jgi:predicted nucleic acid-binding protein
MTVVSDASPLHYLVLIKAEHVLAQLFSEVFVPPAVLQAWSHVSPISRLRSFAS